MERITTHSFFSGIRLMAVGLMLLCATAIHAEEHYQLTFSYDAEALTASVSGITISNPDLFDGEVVIPASTTSDGTSYTVTAIGTTAFYNNTSILSVSLSPALTSIGRYAFFGCGGLKSLQMVEGLESIGSCAFQNCTSLIAVTLPASVTSVGANAFQGCTSLAYVGLNDHNDAIGTAAFQGCTALTTLSIPTSWTQIPASMLYGCTGLRYITIPEGITLIDNNAFYNCSNLTTVSIPSTVITIGSGTFMGCSGLTALTSHAETPPAIETNTFNDVATSIPVYVPLPAVSAYQSDNRWSRFSNILARACDTSYYKESSRTITDKQLPYIWNGQQLTQSGTYTLTLQSRMGCDSIVTLHLTIQPVIEYPTEYDTVCLGEAYQWRGKTLRNQPGTRIHYDRLTYADTGNDSIVWSLSLTTLPAYTVNDIVTIREDALPYLWHGQELTESGHYEDSHLTALGCDSSYTLDLTVTRLPVYTVTVLAEHGTVAGTGTYPEGRQITLEALPESDFEFSMWSDGSTTNPMQFTVTQDTTFMAHFFMPEVTQEVVVDSIEATSVTIIWDTVPGAVLYELKIYRNGRRIAMYHIDKENNIVDSLRFGPERIIARKDSTGGSSETLQVDVGGLEPGEDYTYSLDAMDDDRSYVGAQSGGFATSEEEEPREDDLDETNASPRDANLPRKLLREGRLLILHPDGCLYDISGSLIE